MARTRIPFVIVAAFLCALVWSAPSAIAAPTTVDFEQDAPGAEPNGFASADSDQATFTDSAGADLSVSDFGNQSHGQAMAAFGDDPSELIMDFNVPMKAVSLAFGNDDAGYTSAGDRAALRVFENGNQVGIATQDMNRNDDMDQTVSYTGPPCFTQARFRYESAAGVPINLIEIADDIVFEPCATPTYGGGVLEFPHEVCGDGSDNDFDGKIDDADPDCPPPTQPGPSSDTGIPGTSTAGTGTPANSPPGARTAFQASLLASKATTKCLAGPCLAPDASQAQAAVARGSVYRVAVAGRYRGRPCGGNVRLTYRVKGTRAVKRTAKIGSNCRYRKTIKLKTSRHTLVGATLRIGQRFLGTKTVAPGKAKTLKVKLKHG